MISVKRVKRKALIFVLILFLSNNTSVADEAVLRKVLENGLTFLVKESAPKDLVSINVTVKAGITSEEEYTASGISHLIEHMLFKGTKTRKARDIEKEISSYGGSTITGAVSSDITIYQVTVPSRYMSNALAILKDMLLNANFDEAELQKEREVILKEINMNKDDPERQLILSLFYNAYLNHPYKYPAIGYEKLLKSLTRDDLLRHYNRIYVPNRIVISVVGDIDKEDAASKIEMEFKYFRAPDYRPIDKETEPVQIGRKSSEIESGITLSYLAMAFHSTGILDKDLFSLDVLSMILGRGDNSRLNKKLVKEARTAHSISASNYTPQDPGLFVITALLDKDNIDSAQKDILYEIKMVKEGVIDDKELERAKRMVASDYILSHETIEEQAKNLSESEILTGNYDFFSRYIDSVGKVSKYDVRRAASVYLNENNLTEVRLVPRAAKSSAIKIKKAPLVDRVEKYELSNGLKVLVRRDIKVPAVSISVAFSGGLLVEDKTNNGISNFVSRMLLKGTKNRGEDQIKGAIENLGGDINSFSGFNSFGLNVMVLKNDLDFALELIKDILTSSIFPQKELDIEKSLTIASIKSEDDDIFQKGLLELRKNLFESHPYSMRYIGEAQSLSQLKRDDIVKFYDTYCIPNNTVISVSGDIDPSKVFKSVEELFKDKKLKEIPALKPVKSFAIDRIRKSSLEMDKEETLLMLGFKTVGIKDPDRYALDVLESALSGISGRLFNELRDKLALAYTLGCVQKKGLDTGYMVFYIATTKDKLLQAKSALLGQLMNIKEKGVGDDEIASAKKDIILSHQLFRQTNGYCSLLAALDELYGLGADNMYQYENNIEKVTKGDIQKAANKYLDLNAYAEVVIN